MEVAVPAHQALSLTAFAVLVGAAFATSALSAVVGMAGGITLLAVMLLFYEPLVVIPLHAVIQLVSNSTRGWVQRAHVRRDIVLYYGILLLPGAFVGLAIVRALPADALRTAIGAFTLLATWRPGWLLLGAHPEEVEPHRRFFVLGGISGVLNTTIGAVGPLIAPFFLNMGLDRFALIGTKAVCQTLGHLAKLVVFGLAGFAFLRFAPLLLAMTAAVVAGTWAGTRLLEKIDETRFQLLYRSVLTVIALRLLVAGLLPGS